MIKCISCRISCWNLSHEFVVADCQVLSWLSWKCEWTRLGSQRGEDEDAMTPTQGHNLPRFFFRVGWTKNVSRLWSGFGHHLEAKLIGATIGKIETKTQTKGDGKKVAFTGLFMADGAPKDHQQHQWQPSGLSFFFLHFPFSLNWLVVINILFSSIKDQVEGRKENPLGPPRAGRHIRTDASCIGPKWSSESLSPSTSNKSG